jgi:hypothetical protein
LIAKKKKVKKLSVTKVQAAVNKMIREHDERCIVRDGKHECCGMLTASHFYCIGGNSTFRFYPPNIHTQCFGHHGIHERGQDPFFYRRWMEAHEPSGLDFMERNWGKIIRYSQPVLRDIMAMAQRGQIELLTAYIEEMIKNA